MLHKLYDYIKKISKNRILSLIILLIILGSLFIYYAENFPQHGQYGEINKSNKFVAFSGEVTAIYEDYFVLTYYNQIKNHDINVKSTTNVSLGDTVQIQGYFISPNTIQANIVVVSNSWDKSFVFYRSVFGLLILLIIFFRYWRFILNKFLFVRRI
ncbi:MAG: hypothetical protein APG12_01702 [Candidatus Methanofastidiosum methylothiophilum]|jgi:hypothetical protein|uniref:Uncharacterized protein n=1 Tax=Candidatus Methanofastidiosum methylothiophilum TaxID=1705564 RepID=A0A150IPN5_9EURY|nr:MAG: hypothetical protein APG10_01054 [Candidatus Methanofastidiosum methylthiophilus]KYC46927.1 MAG: hypothetical protein APG11_01562 [Candidatus Methanofastidiosum methylthiophilus]KYC49059.1 MAG: hypothetical protein APG12_01702 [Candidatus Methanofastidiosum methylthiophilus]